MWVPLTSQPGAGWQPVDVRLKQAVPHLCGRRAVDFDCIGDAVVAVGDPHAAQHSTAQRIELRHSTVTAAMRCPRPTGQNRFNAGMHTMRCRVHSVQCKVAGRHHRHHATLAVLVHRRPCKQARLPSGQASLLTTHLQENSSCDPCRRATTSPLNPPPTTRPSLHPAHRRQVKVSGGCAHSCWHSRPRPDVRTEQTSRRCGGLDPTATDTPAHPAHPAPPFTAVAAAPESNPAPQLQCSRSSSTHLAHSVQSCILPSPGATPPPGPPDTSMTFVSRCATLFHSCTLFSRTWYTSCAAVHGRGGRGRKTRRTPHVAHAFGL